jgi:hypothetical protein
MSTHQDYNPYRVLSIGSYIATEASDDMEFFKRCGFVITKHGIVGYYATAEEFTLDVVVGGMCYTRCHEIPHPTVTQIERYANHFAKEIYNR